MLENFLVALQVVIPMALLMAVGVLVRKVKVIDPPTMRKVDTLTFRIFMPLLLFKNIYETDLSSNFNGRGMVFAAVCITATFLMALILPKRLVPDRNQAASIGQAIIRNNYILFGLAVAESLYGEGNVGGVALLGAMAVPLTNAYSAVVLELNRSGAAKPAKLLLSVLKNPMVISAALALALLGLHIRIPGLLYQPIKSLAAVATPIAFLSLGVSLNLGELRANRRPLAVGVLLRMALIPLIFLPITAAMGFHGQTLCGMIVLFGAPTAVASYPMAVAMGADGPLAGQLVCATTVVSVFTIFCYTFLFRSLGML